MEGVLMLSSVEYEVKEFYIVVKLGKRLTTKMNFIMTVLSQMMVIF